MKKLTISLLALNVSICLFTSNLSFAADKKSVNQQLLELLKDKKIVSEQQYKEFNQQLTEEEAERILLKYDKGVRLGDTGGKFNLKINGRMENDFTAVENKHPGDDGFTVRRAWLTIVAKGHKYFALKLQPDFSGANRIQDASVDITCSPQLKFRIGQLKTPFSLDWTIASKYRDFIFRSLPTINLSPDRDRGAIVQGELAEGKLFYTVGVMNGSRLSQNDADKHKDVVARLIFSPFQENSQSASQGLHFGGAMTYGHQDVSMATDSGAWWSQGRLQNPATGTTFFQFNNGVSQDGNRGRYGLEAIWMSGPLSFSGEWMQVQLENLSVGNQRGDFDFTGYYVAMSYFLTGEEQTFKNGVTVPIVPTNNFNPEAQGTGAVQLVARYERVNVDEALLTQGYANASQYSKGATNYTIGATWYLNDMLRIMCNYIHTRFDDPVLVSARSLEDENAVITRFQFIF